MRLGIGFAALVAVASLTVLPAFADQHGHPATPHASAPKSTPAPPHQTVTTARPHGKPLTTRPASTSAKRRTTTTAKPSPAGSTTSTRTGTAGTTTTAGTNPIATKIASHPQLASKLRKMLPSGISLAAASNGFKNQGQFIAALHVSKNLNIPFRQLKMVMTGAHPASLGQAIQTLRQERSATEATAQVTHAEQQASDDLATTKVTTTTRPLKTKAHKG